MEENIEEENDKENDYYETGFTCWCRCICQHPVPSNHYALLRAGVAPVLCVSSTGSERTRNDEKVDHVGLTNLDGGSIQDTTTHPTLHAFLASLDDADKKSKRPEMAWRDGAINGARNELQNVARV